MAGNYNEIESLILKRVMEGLAERKDPTLLYTNAEGELTQAIKNLESNGAGSRVSPTRNLDNCMRSQGLGAVVEHTGGPAAD
ncbi:MAG: hypothetical protein AAB557_05845 [Patescibacteria group bacterium]